jgi:hypothetical protein
MNLDWIDRFHETQYVNVEMQSDQTQGGLVKQDTIGPHDLAATVL